MPEVTRSGAWSGQGQPQIGTGHRSRSTSIGGQCRSGAALDLMVGTHWTSHVTAHLFSWNALGSRFVMFCCGLVPAYFTHILQITLKKKCPIIGDAIPKNGDNWSNCSSRNSPVSWGQHGTHLGPTGPRWAPCWSHELCYLGQCRAVITHSVFSKILPTGTPQRALEGEVWGVFCEYKRWFRWCVAHCGTICNIMLYLSAI